MNSNTTPSLAPGTMLHGEVYNYKITKVLGQGSYGITYLAETVNSNEATCLVAIKELFIREACTRTGTTASLPRSTSMPSEPHSSRCSQAMATCKTWCLRLMRKVFLHKNF